MVTVVLTDVYRREEPGGRTRDGGRAHRPAQ